MAKKRENFTLDEEITVQLQKHSNKNGQSKSFIVNELLKGFFGKKESSSDVTSYIEERGLEDDVDEAERELAEKDLSKELWDL